MRREFSFTAVDHRCGADPSEDGARDERQLDAQQLPLPRQPERCRRSDELRAQRAETFLDTRAWGTPNP
jgi:uncharacterized protein YPO0396